MHSNSKLTPKVLEEGEFADELAPGTSLLLGQFVIEAHLNSGGFGITYLAKDSLHRRVVIKECFPGTFCRRSKTIVGVRTRAHAKEFRTIVDLFVQEARQLARLRHPNIVGVHQVFLDNDTAYMALDYIEGRDLLEILEDPDTTLSPKVIQEMTIKLLDAIEFIHGQGILHRDISPDNILINKSMEPILIDFGAARETATRKTRLLGAMRTVKDGYSPQEFYLSDAAQHPSSDLYSLGASLYHLITNDLPPDAQERLAAIAGGEPDPYVPIAERAGQGYSPAFLDAIDMALNVFPKNRIQSAADWRATITHTRASSVTRGTVSRPMLAVDNGNVVTQIRSLVRDNQLATEQDLQEAGLIPERKMPVRKNRTEGDERSERIEPVPSFGANERSGKPIGLIAGAVVLAVAAGGAALYSLGGSSDVESAVVAVEPASDEANAASPAPEEVAAEPPAAATPTPDVEVAAAPEPEETAPVIETPAEDIAVAPVETPDEVAEAPAVEAAAPVTEVVEEAEADLAATPDVSTPETTTVTAAMRPPARPQNLGEPELSSVAPEVSEAVETPPILAGEENSVDIVGGHVLNANRTSPRIAALPSAGGQPSVDLNAPAPIVRAAPAPQIDPNAVVVGPAVNFPFVVNANEIVALFEGAPDVLEPGFIILSINGFPVSDFRSDAQMIVKATGDFQLGQDVEVTLGLENTLNGDTLVQPVTLSTVQETALLNGIRFRSQFSDNEWKTVVIESAERGSESLQAGDVVVALMPTTELVNGPTSIGDIISRELASGATQFNFAVRRNGEMYLVSMNYSGTKN